MSTLSSILADCSPGDVLLRQADRCAATKQTGGVEARSMTVRAKFVIPDLPTHERFLK